MSGLVFWSVIATIAAGLGIATTDTQAFVNVAKGLEKAGILGQSAQASAKPSIVSIGAHDAAAESPVVETPAAVLVPAQSSESVAMSDDVQVRFNQLEQAAIAQWGSKNAVMPSQSQIVKYAPDMKSRSIIDVKDGKLIVEVLSDKATDLQLYHTLIQALLTPDDPRQVDVLSTADYQITGKPFLLGQIVDSLGKPIDSIEHAQRFAAWAMVNRHRQYSTPQGQVQRIELALDANHKQVRAARFAHLIEAAADRYGLDENLLYAITETESHFNPFAISRTGAVGLMQLVASKSGRDALKAETGQDRVPTQDELKDPANNIRLGAAYIARLDRHYLKDVSNPTTRELAVIAAYNGGAVRALRVFGEEKAQAIAQMNQLPPQIVYDALKKKHQSAETRGYVQKVTQAKRRYSARV
jgi:membrane-bound lytic murein transglycosylase C